MVDGGRGNSPVKVEESDVEELDSLGGLFVGEGIGSVEETIGGRDEFKNAEAVPCERRAALSVLKGGGDRDSETLLPEGVRALDEDSGACDGDGMEEEDATDGRG